MPEMLTPQLNKISVQIGQLVLDPNNPRLVTDESNHRDTTEFVNLDRTGTTEARMTGINSATPDPYKIEQIINSIKENGWQPVDFMFVQQIPGEASTLYVVLEGNRRLTALRKLCQDSSSDTTNWSFSTKIEVMKVEDEGDPVMLKRKIAYLLGVRHHGALVRWSAYAQAQNIYEHYMGLNDNNMSDFTWNSNDGVSVAGVLSINLKAVQDRLKVYCVMNQLKKHTDIANSEGGIQAKYYSVCAELLLRKFKRLNDYISQNSHTFLLEESGIRSMNNLCHFSNINRGGAPIRNPQEWRFFDNILNYENEPRRKEMLDRVLDVKHFPSDVWAEIESEQQTLQWDHWLAKIHKIIAEISIGDDLQSENAKKVGRRLSNLIIKLDDMDKNE